MFQSSRKPKSGFGSALSIAELVYHSVVRNVRKQHNNAFIAIAMSNTSTNKLSKVDPVITGLACYQTAGGSTGR